MTDRASEPDWCGKCHAPIIPRGAAELAWSWLCWWLVMRWPDRWFVNRAHMAILPWAGNIAFRCTCWSNQGRARAKEQG